MQQSTQRTGSRRQEERVPLEARVELRAHDGAEPRNVDGLNVSIGGLALRAASIPPVGATVRCRFACPPGDEPIDVRGEVVWARLDGAAQGRFGVRFLELDTKSATSLQRFVGPGPGGDRLRSATIRIDGLGSSVEAELKLADDTRVVLEQELSFLQLGRAVEVSLEGRGPERGRIASVELRQSALGGPTIVYGVLLDGSASSEVALPPPAASAAPLFTAPPPPLAAASPRVPALTESVEQPITARMSLPPSGMQPVAARVAVPPRARRASEPPSPVRRSSQPPVARAPGDEPRIAVEPPAPRPAWTGRARDTLPAAPAPPPTPFDHETETVLASALPPHPALADEDDEPTRVHVPGADGQSAEDWRDVARRLDEADEPPGDDADADADAAPPQPATGLRALPLKVGLLTRAAMARVRSLGARAEPAEPSAPAEPAAPTELAAPGEPAPAEDGDTEVLPDLRTRLLLHVARVRGLLLAAWAWLRGALGGDGEASRPALRVQRATLPGGGPGELRDDAPRRVRMIAALLTLLGVALGVYALTPVLADRSETEDETDPAEAPVPEPAAPAPVAEPEEALELQLDEPARPPTPVLAPKRRVAAKSKSEPPAERAPVRASIGDPESTPIDDPPEAAPARASAAGGTSVFGDGEVPNGRTFTLRMNGPVKQLQGDARQHGFTVRIPGRVAIDRASPIASAHNSVARAMILNRSGYAELTVEFRPGVIPRYQVRGKDNALEVTLERL